MKRIFMLIIVSSLTTSIANAQLKEWGVGIKIGSPTAISLKRYLSNATAMEFTLGTSPEYDYDYAYYYNNNYRHYDYYNHQSSIALQLRYYFRKELNLGEITGLEWYWGPGIQYRHSNGILNYWDKYGNYHSDKVTDLDFGVDVVLGVEYTLENAPVSFSLDFNPFIELTDRYYWHWQGGLGVRYNF